MDIIEFARMGGQARARALSPSKRKEIAIKAINKRWNKTVDTYKQVLEPERPRCKGKLGRFQCPALAEFGAYCRTHRV